MLLYKFEVNMSLTKENFVNAYVSVVAKVAAADGNISEDETARIKGSVTKLFSRKNIEISGDSVEAVLSNPNDFSESCAVLKGLTAHEKLGLIKNFIAVAAVDEVVSTEEISSINEITTHLFDEDKHKDVQRYVAITLELEQLKENIGVKSTQ